MNKWRKKSVSLFLTGNVKTLPQVQRETLNVNLAECFPSPLLKRDKEESQEALQAGPSLQRDETLDGRFPAGWTKADELILIRWSLS